MYVTLYLNGARWPSRNLDVGFESGHPINTASELGQVRLRHIIPTGIFIKYLGMLLVYP